MKNIFKLLSVMFVAGAMMMVSCEKDPKDDPVNPDVKKYTITVNCNDDSMGTVTGGGVYEEGKNIQISATANEGYKFVKWQDGVTEASRTILVSKDETYTATFEADAPADGINVTFGSDTWAAGYFGIVNYDAYGLMNIIAYKSQTSAYPSIDILATNATGTHEETAQEGFMSGETFYNVDYYESSSLFALDQTTGDTIWYGDWWAKSATINTTEFEANAGYVTTVVNATMFSALEAFVHGAGLEGAPVKTMNVSCGHVELLSKKAAAAPAKRIARKISVK